jgi:hypothetical protein
MNPFLINDIEGASMATYTHMPVVGGVPVQDYPWMMDWQRTLFNSTTSSSVAGWGLTSYRATQPAEELSA